MRRKIMKLAYLLSFYSIFILSQLTYGAGVIEDSLASFDTLPAGRAMPGISTGILTGEGIEDLRASFDTTSFGLALPATPNILNGGGLRLPEKLEVKTKLRRGVWSAPPSGGATPLASPWLSTTTTPYASPLPEGGWFSPSNGPLNTPDQINGFVQRQTVEHIGYIGSNIPSEGKGIICIDADEVLFCTQYNQTSDSEKLVRLYQPLEDLFRRIRELGHKLYILTYNKADTIREKLALVSLDESLFDGIVAAEMTGDVMTAKGVLFRGIISEADTKPDYAVFIDNFPIFVEDVERVATELSLPLYSYHAVGYKGHYKKLVYYRLQKLAQRLADGEDITRDCEKIARGLAKYNISLEGFRERYASFKAFRKAMEGKDLIWPYCTYM